jgi:N-acetylglucosamine-6-phosphate deacetylase
MTGTGQSTHTVVAQRLFDGEHWLGKSCVSVQAGLIAGVTAAHAGAAVDVALLAPGFIDLQVNGGGGALLNDAPTAATVRTMLAAHRGHGTTGILPTMITDHPDRLQALAASATEIAALPGVLGLHLEGPFLNPARKGVHPAAFIRQPTEADVAAITTMTRVLPVLVTLAPECVPAGFIAQLVALGVRVAIGHSDATAEQVAAACDAGATAVTHLYNAMSQLTARAPGVVGAAFDDARLTAGIICDGLHVAPANLRIAFRLMGRDRLALVTDAMPSLGGGATFTLHGRTITLAEGRLTAPDGTLAGAHLGMDAAVRHAQTMLGATLEDALVMAARTPARMLGLDATHGRIAAGFAADLVALTEEGAIAATWVAGARD